MRRHLTCGLLLLAAAAAQAEVRLDLVVRPDGGVPDTTYTITDPYGAFATHALASGGAAASGTADLGAGLLRTYAQSPAGSTSGAASGAQAVIGDSFEFSGPYGGIAYLDYHFSGNITTMPNRAFPAISHGGLGVYIANSSTGASKSYSAVLENYSGGCAAFLAALSSLGCWEGASISLDGTIPITVAPGSFYFLMSLYSNAVMGDTVDFSNTGLFSLRLPEGVSIASRSGTFIPTSPVPEPASSALLLLGLLLLTLRHGYRCRRSR